MIDLEKDHQERLEKLTETYNVVKENPYWATNFDENLLPKLIDDYFEMIRCVWFKEYTEDSPYYVILRCCGHDTCCMLSNMRYMLEDKKYGPIDDSFKKHFNTVLQSYLTNVQCLLNRCDFNENIIGYTDTNGRHLKKYTVVYRKDDKWQPYKAVRIIRTQEEYDEMKAWLEKEANRTFESNTKKWAIECLQELENGEKIIGNRWLIKI